MRGEPPVDAALPDLGLGQDLPGDAAAPIPVHDRAGEDVLGLPLALGQLSSDLDHVGEGHEGIGSGDEDRVRNGAGSAVQGQAGAALAIGGRRWIFTISRPAIRSAALASGALTF